MSGLVISFTINLITANTKAVAAGTRESTDGKTQVTPWERRALQMACVVAAARKDVQRSEEERVPRAGKAFRVNVGSLA